MPDRYERDDPTLYDLAYDRGTGVRPQVQDQWGRSPGHPDYGRRPPTGYGTPESGYGPGGVNNPAFQGTTVPSGGRVNPGGSGTLPNGQTVPPGTTAPPPNGTGTTTSGSSWNNGQFGGSYNLDRLEQRGGTRFHGFNDERALSAGDQKSTKDLYRRVVGSLGLDLVQEGLGNNPEAFANAERLLRERIVPELKARGADVLDIKKDKILVRTAENPQGEWVDVFSEVGADSVANWWGADGTSSASAAPGGVTPGATPDVGTPAPGTSRAPVNDVAYRELAGEEAGDSLFDLAYLYNPREREML